MKLEKEQEVVAIRVSLDTVFPLVRVVAGCSFGGKNIILVFIF